MTVGLAAVAAGWYSSARNGLGVDRQGHLVPARASWHDPFLLAMYALILVGGYLAIAGVNRSWWLPGVSGAEERRRLHRLHREEVDELLGHALRQGQQWLDDRTEGFDPDRWERRTHDLIERSLGLAEAALFRDESGLHAQTNARPKRTIELRCQRLGGLVGRFPHLAVKEDFVPVTWAMVDAP